MANTPPPPNPAPQPGDANASNSQGGIVRDVSSILANLNQEQLASIVAAAVSTITVRLDPIRVLSESRDNGAPAEGITKI